MKIGIDCRLMLDPQNERGGGIERYAFTLATELVKMEEHTFVLFIPSGYQSEDLFSQNENVELVSVPNYSSFFGRHFGFSRLVDKHNVDVFYSPSTMLPIGLNTKGIVTIHDFAIYEHPEWFPKGQWFSKQVLVPFSLQKAERVVAVSEASKQSCVELFNIEEKKIDVVYNTLPDKKLFYKQPTHNRTLPEKFILFIGTLEPRKNLERVFHTFMGLKNDTDFNDLSLVVIGNEGWRMDAVFNEYLQEELEKSGVVFLKNITETEKWRILERSELLFFPSLYEGFGLPVLEAFSVGKKVITTKEGALEEVGGNDAIYVDALDVNSMIAALKIQLRKSPEKFTPDAKQFSAEAFRDGVSRVLEKMSIT